MKFDIPFYHILNMLLTGVIFIFCSIFIVLDKLAGFDFAILEKLSNISIIAFNFSLLGVLYCVGLIINRIGSLLLEPIIFKIIGGAADYELFTLQSEKYPIMKILSREYALSRTQCTLFICILIMTMIFKEWHYIFFPLIVSLTFLFSAIKHSRKIKKLCYMQNSAFVKNS